MRRGDVVWVDLEPTRGSEANKRRPAVIVSNDGANRTAEALGRGVVSVVPLSRSVRVVHPFQVFIPAGTVGLKQASKAQAEQVRSVSVDRLGASAGRLPAETIEAVDDALRMHLGL